MKPRFQFRLRTLLIGVTLFCLVVGYFGRQFQIVRERRAVLSQMESSDFSVTAGYYDWSRPEADREQGFGLVGIPFIVDVNGGPTGPMLISSGSQTSGPLLIRRWLGDVDVKYIRCERKVSIAEVQRIAKCFPEADVYWCRY